MEKILAVIKEEIKTEAVKEDADLAKLKNLFDLAERVKSMTISGVDQVPGFSTSFTTGARQAMPMAYGPSPMERLVGELMPMINTWIEHQAANGARSSLNNLLAEYRLLKVTDPDLAEKLKSKILRLAEKDKEETHENLHPELSGGHSTSQSGSENQAGVQRADGHGENEPGEVSQALQTQV